MKKVRIITGVLAAALIAASFAGCGDKTETQDVSALKQEQGQVQNTPRDHKGTMAKVVSLDGNQLTVILAGMPDRRGDGSTPPAMNAQSGSTPPAMNAQSGSTPPAMSDQSSGATPPDNGQGPAGGQPGQGGGKIEFTGEQTTYTLSDDVAVMKGSGGNAAEIDLSELKADDVIRFTTVKDSNGNEMIDAIIVLE